MFIGLSGKIGSGKSTISNYLKEKYNFNILSFKDIIVKEINQKGLAPSRVNLQDTGNDLYNKLGPENFCDLLIENCNPNTNYVIDSIRHLKINLYMKNKFGNKYFLIFTDTIDDTRYKRIMIRDNNVLFDAESHHVESEIELIRAKCDYFIVNDNNIDKLYSDVDLIFKNIFDSRC